MRILPMAVRPLLLDRFKGANGQGCQQEGYILRGNLGRDLLRLWLFGVGLLEREYKCSGKINSEQCRVSSGFDRMST